MIYQELLSFRLFGLSKPIGEGCKSRIFRGVSFLCLAACCTVLRSRWYQSGIKPFEKLWSGVEIARPYALGSHSYGNIYLKRYGAPGAAATAKIV
jgi:hypothetical protein